MRKTLWATAAAATLVAGLTAAGAQPQGNDLGTKGPEKPGTGVTSPLKGKTSADEKGKTSADDRRGAVKGPTGATVGKEPEQKSGEIRGKERTGEDRSGEMRGKERTGEDRGQMRGKERTGEDRDRTQPQGQTTEPRERTGAAPRTKGSVTVELTPDQRTRIHDKIVHHREGRVGGVNFALSIGTAIPRTVHVYDLPADIVEVVPEYRGFKYIIVNDELVVIDPDTLEIVAVLPV